MSEHLPDVDKLPAKDLSLSDAKIILRNVPAAAVLLAEIARLQRENDTCGLQCSATMKSLLAENEKLRTALTGISTCSTCEACRGAALYAKEQRPFTAEEAKSYGDFIRDFFDDGDQITQCMVCESRFSDEAAKALKSRVAGSSQPPEAQS